MAFDLSNGVESERLCFLFAKYICTYISDVKDTRYHKDGHGSRLAHLSLSELDSAFTLTRPLLFVFQIEQKKVLGVLTCNKKGKELVSIR